VISASEVFEIRWPRRPAHNGPVTAVRRTAAEILCVVSLTTGFLCAQTSAGNLPSVVPADSSFPADAPAVPTSAASSPAAAPATTSSPTLSQRPPNKAEKSLFDSLFMSGRTQADFVPLTPKKRAKVYALGLLSPFHLFMVASTAGTAQFQNVPHEWGQGVEGYSRRFGNYMAIDTIGATLQMGGEDLLHEDCRYYGSGEDGFGRRVKYAVASIALCRSADGARHFSFTQIGSWAGAAFISRLWQPPSNTSAGDGAVSFGISAAINTGINVIKEFLPDLTQHFFGRKNQARPPTAMPTSAASTNTANFRPQQ
jgi:hypothetical protein